MVVVGCGTNNIEKANELIKLGSFDESISLLTNEIKKKPKNKEAHLALGNTYASYYFKNVDDNDDSNKKLVDKAVQYYKSALLIDKNYTEALHNLSDFYLYIGEREKATAGYNELAISSEKYPVSNLYDSDFNKSVAFMKTYSNTINSNERYEIVPQKNNGNIIISKKCDAGVEPILNGLSSVNLNKFEIFTIAKESDTGIKADYDTYDELGKKKQLYKVSLHALINYSSGKKFKLHKEKEFKYAKRLYRRRPSKKEVHILSSIPWFNGDASQMSSGNINKLFAGNHRFGIIYFKQHPEYKIHERLPYVEKSDYREIVDIGEPSSYSVKYLGFHNNTGKMKIQEVSARKYIKSIKRFCIVPNGAWIYGSGDLQNDNQIIEWLNYNDMLNDADKIVYLSGTAYKGTFKAVINTLYGKHLKLENKYYIDGSSYEYWKIDKAGMTILFVNQVFEGIV